MRQSSERILTTHAGSLPRPDEVIERGRARPERPADPYGWSKELGPAVREVVERQRQINLYLLQVVQALLDETTRLHQALAKLKER